jgi:hypothetical protein
MLSGGCNILIPAGGMLITDRSLDLQYRWVSYHIGSGGKQVEIEKVGAPESTWEEFIDALPDDQCRYGGME